MNSDATLMDGTLIWTSGYSFMVLDFDLLTSMDWIWGGFFFCWLQFATLYVGGF